MDHFDYDDEPTIFRRYWYLIAAIILIVGFAVWGAIKKFAKPDGSSRAHSVSVVRLPPPPPPAATPPPPPPPQQVQEQKMIEQSSVDDSVEKPDDTPPEPASPLSTNVAGNGPADGFGLGAHRGGQGGGGKGGNRGGRWGWYAAQVQSKIGEALRGHPKTRSANIRIEARIWPDATGRITRAQIVGSTGDASIDSALKNEILTGLQLKEPPPKGMPAPIIMRLTAKRPN